jgi:acetylornithine deacetylase/succinyl-diaminopimelate desuccinylase-like protein
VEELYRMDQELESKEWHHLIPQRPSIQLGILRAGDFYNRLPGSVEIVGTVRWDPQENFKDVRTRLEGRLSQLEERIRSTLDHEIEMRLELDLSRDSSEIDSENPLVRAVQSAIAKTVGHPIPLAGWRVVSDQPFFVREAGIPAIYFGPFTDDDMTAHSDCESVSIERLVLMAQVYAASALLYCGFTT